MDIEKLDEILETIKNECTLDQKLLIAELIFDGAVIETDSEDEDTAQYVVYTGVTMADSDYLG